MASQYAIALRIIDEIIADFGLDDAQPKMLHHFTSVEVSLNILKNRDLWLCNAEYLNDADEIRGAHKLILQQVTTQRRSSRMVRQEDFLEQVMRTFEGKARMYEAFVFCMSEAIKSTSTNASDKPRYAQFMAGIWENGRGVCISYFAQHFHTLSKRSSLGTRLSKVIYEELIQERIVDKILDEGWKHLNISNNPSDAVEATVAALIFMMPVMKNDGFKDEHEWRFIYLPDVEDHTVSKRKFFARDGLIVPYYTLLDADPDPINLPIPTEIMVGPSVHQELNVRSLDYVRDRAVMRVSKIPYRG